MDFLFIIHYLSLSFFILCEKSQKKMLIEVLPFQLITSHKQLRDIVHLPSLLLRVFACILLPCAKGIAIVLTRNGNENRYSEKSRHSV